MAYYLQLLVLTDEGRLKFEADPDWIKELNANMELMGVKIKTQYALLGQWDFVNIIEAPSDEVAATAGIRLSASRMVHPMTLAAIPLENLAAALKKGTRPPW